MPAPTNAVKPSAPRLVRAIVAADVASPSATLTVRIPSYGNALSEVAAWPPVEPLPSRGDVCIVAYDEGGVPFVIGWERMPSHAVVSALPSAPFDGQVIYFQSEAMAALGVVWQLRYRAASASAYKWEYVGGAGLHEYTTGGEKAVVVGTWNLIPGGPTITLPLAGDYDVRAQATIIESAAVYGTISMGIGHNGTPTEDLAIETTTFANAANARANLTILTRMPGRSAADVLALYYEVNETETLKTSKCHLAAQPVRVG